MDCVDQTSTHVPNHWSVHNYGQDDASSTWEQKMMLCIIEGKPTQLRYYAGTPYVGCSS